MLQIHEQQVLGVFISWISLWWLSRFGNTSGIEVEVVLLDAFGMTLSIVRMESTFMIIQMLRAAESKYWEAIECHYHSPPITHVKCIARSNLLIWFTLSAPGTLYAGENFMLRFRFPARHSFANVSKFKRCFCHGCETYLGKLCQLISLDLGKHQPGYPFESPEAILQRQSLQRFGQHVSKFVGKCWQDSLWQVVFEGGSPMHPHIYSNGCAGMTGWAAWCMWLAHYWHA